MKVGKITTTLPCYLPSEQGSSIISSLSSMSMRVFSLHYIVFTKFTSSANIRFRSCSTWRCHASFSDPVKLVISSLNKFTLVAVKIAVEGLKMNYLILDKKESLASLETRRGLERKCVPQLFLGLLLGTRQSSIGQCFSVVLSNSPRSHCESFLLVSKVAN